MKKEGEECKKKKERRRSWREMGEEQEIGSRKTKKEMGKEKGIRKEEVWPPVPSPTLMQ